MTGPRCAVQIRCSVEERDRWRAAAYRNGCTVADLVRAGLESEIERLRDEPPGTARLEELLAELGLAA